MDSCISSQIGRMGAQSYAAFNRGMLARQGREITLLRNLPAPSPARRKKKCAKKAVKKKTVARRSTRN